MSGGKRLSGNRIQRLDQQIKRATTLADISEKNVAELYLIHKELCGQSRACKLRRRRRRRASE